MNAFKLTTAAMLATGLVLSARSTVFAQSMSQDQQLDQSVHVNCNVGAYGQSSSCTADATQSGRQYQRMNLEGRRIVYRADGTAIVVHDPVDTALDFQTMAAFAGTIVSGAVAFALKNRVA